ncbi:YbaY family lipoprotein [Coraliomargarita akajimensis]|uniref:DUF306 domain-containing protein n=1 Tax=Coraliomargarita akajimensis (strain DSM 45221 / IAM 15411 / JCM 23193 / KCTC 12865 / 04OKA010-24) TaxID=583355 RepID=D5EP16_CORAD|nr:YbaY family lipoprotein [Coraliomargarita akajimensis]ADE55526.1 protein of unknown function DUF306 Meta and HslJ [Coraliomargarita akajimensis DSM 45221]
MKAVTRILVLGCIAILLAACAHRTPQAEIRGVVSYRERIALPPGAVMTVALEDVSRMDVAATVLASTQVELNDAPPHAFTLPYDPAEIQDRMRYGLRVRIEVDGQLRFINDRHIDPFADDEALSIVLKATGNKRSLPAQKPDASLTETYWKLVTIQGRQVEMGAGGKELQMTLRAAGDRVTGFSGCNHFHGGYTVDGQALAFGPLASTAMACASGMEQEQAFQTALRSIERYVIQGDTLMLFGQGPDPLLQFEAVYLP